MTVNDSEMCVSWKKSKFDQYRRYQSWDSLGDYSLRRKGRVKELDIVHDHISGYTCMAALRGYAAARVWNSLSPRLLPSHRSLMSNFRGKLKTELFCAPIQTFHCTVVLPLWYCVGLFIIHIFCIATLKFCWTHTSPSTLFVFYITLHNIMAGQL